MLSLTEQKINKAAAKLQIDKQSQSIKDEQLEQIIKSISESEDLRELNLNLLQNEITTKGVTTLKTIWQKCKKLNSLNLNLQNNRFGDDGVKALGSGLKSMAKRLTSLTIELTNTNIFKKGLVSFASDISHLSALENLELHLGYNVINKCLPSIGTIFSQLHILQRLSLDIYEIMLEDKEFISFCSGLNQCHELQIFDLNIQGNFVSKEGALALAKALHKMKKLSSLQLNLEGNAFGEGFNEIGKTIAQMNYLRILDLSLSQNGINDEIVYSFLPSLSECKFLVVFKMQLGSHKVTDVGMTNLLNCLQQCAYLKYLKLDLNTEDTKKLLYALECLIFSLDHLLSLDIRLNQKVKEISLNSVIEQIAAHKKLNTLIILSYGDLKNIATSIQKRAINLINCDSF